MNDQGNGSSENFPLTAAVVLFGVLAFVIGMLLVGSGVTTTAARPILQLTTVPSIVPTQVAAEATEVVASPEPAAEVAGLPALDPQKVAVGKQTFQTTCFACHGMDAHGIPGLGKDLVTSAFVHGLTDEALVEFIAIGRQAFDAANTTGIAMPPRGGNPAITDDQLMDVVYYLRSLSPNQPVAPASTVATTVPAAPPTRSGTSTPFALPINAVLGTTAPDESSTATPFALPIDAVLGASAPDEATAVPAAAVPATDVPATAVPATDIPATARPAPDVSGPTSVPFALPIDSVLTPSGN